MAVRVPLSQLTPSTLFSRFGEGAHRVFLDTAGNVPKCADPPRSFLAAEPDRIVSGNLCTEAELLAEGVASTLQAKGPSGAGWFGTVDYDGQFWFAHYPHVLVYEHGSQQWVASDDVAWDFVSGEEKLLDIPLIGEWAASSTRGDFETSVQRAQDYIAAGDIYQVNLSQKFSAKIAAGSLCGLYQRLRQTSPAPMAAFLETDGREILSSSPELFLKMMGSAIETRPIKGTRPRHADAAMDIRSSHELRTSEKEVAELIMITDLLRNDLGRISQFGSVRVDALAQLESLAQVHHLVSTVRGTLREGISHVAALASCSPGGSITGAPKKRSIEIIAELEPVPRGLYTGSIGYFGDHGDSQFSIAIRTLVLEGGQLHYHVGAGIVADSVPALEYEETLHKARGMRLALGIKPETVESSLGCG